jgi:signal transduction histidine kinase
LRQAGIRAIQEGDMGEPERGSKAAGDDHASSSAHASERAKPLRRDVRDEGVLAAAGTVLGASLDVATTARDFATFIVQTARLADACTVDVLRTNAVTQRHVATLSTVESSDAPDAELPVRPSMQESDGKVIVRLPLATRGRTLGALTAIGPEGRRLVDADLALLDELGKRAAVALENATAYADARTALRRRDEVLIAVSHDLRAPLTGLLINSMRLLRAIDAEGASYSSRKLADSIKRSADRLRHFVQEVLDVERIEGGALSIQKRHLDPAALVGEVLEIYAPLASEKSLTLAVDVRHHRSFPCDRERFLQVLGNLVGNAIKFTAAGGTVTIDVETKDKDVLFRVRDTGAGIPEGQLSHVFERLFRARTSEANAEGIGLGLAIAKGIVEAHGGTIWAESTVGVGSTFCFTLPAQAS